MAMGQLKFEASKECLVYPAFSRVDAHVIDDCSTKTTINKRTIVDLPAGKAGILAFKTRFGKEKASKTFSLSATGLPYPECIET